MRCPVDLSDIAPDKLLAIKEYMHDAILKAIIKPKQSKGCQTAILAHN